MSSLLMEISASTEGGALDLVSEDFVARSFFLLPSDTHYKNRSKPQSI